MSFVKKETHETKHRGDKEYKCNVIKLFKTQLDFAFQLV